MIVECIDQIERASPAEWDALGDPNNPFTTHAFLSVLEKSGSVSPETGWQPVHIVLREEKSGPLLAAAPLYIKGHSYGEYIFDWSWAEAAQGAGLLYYPKLLCAVPFTPATGPRFLVGSSSDKDQKMEVLWQGMRSLADSIGASSIHCLFLPKEQAHQIQVKGDRLYRKTHQFYWTNPGVEKFDEWLGLFRSKERKKVLRERQKAHSSVDSIVVLKGQELDDSHIQTLWRFYQDTCARKWGQPYLKHGFFKSLNKELSDMTRVFVAKIGSKIVATSLCFERGSHLYGRYWGCDGEYDSLHFELCYHRPIEYCLKNGLSRFEAGAQGHHKIKRGLLAEEIHSLHWFAHEGLSEAVEASLTQESVRIATEIDILNNSGPFRRGSKMPEGG